MYVEHIKPFCPLSPVIYLPSCLQRVIPVARVAPPAERGSVTRVNVTIATHSMTTAKHANVSSVSEHSGEELGL